MTDAEKLAFARRMLELGYPQWDAVLRGIESFERCAASHLEDLVGRRLPRPSMNHWPRP